MASLDDVRHKLFSGIFRDFIFGLVAHTTAFFDFLDGVVLYQDRCVSIDDFHYFFTFPNLSVTVGALGVTAGARISASTS